MTNEKWFKKEDKKSICMGTGLIALDIIFEENRKSEIEILAGGSCGNVLIILSYLGWDSYPIAYLRDDNAAQKLLNDLEEWQVNTDFIYKSENGNTPIIIEKFGISEKGKPWHRFEWNCPFCGLRFPKYKSIPLSEIKKINKDVPEVSVFYFDRVRKSSLELAKESKQKGAIIVFEPSGITNQSIFFECLEVADIVKYSRERLGKFKNIIGSKSIPLEIETLDEEGLMYRFNGEEKFKGNWKKIQSYPVKEIKDTVGAGDWCTAGIIHILGKEGRKGFENASEKEIREALEFGQLLSAFKCYYEGARGCMYDTSMEDFKRIIYSIWEGKDPLEFIESSKKELKSKYYVNICPFCSEEIK